MLLWIISTVLTSSEAPEQIRILRVARLDDFAGGKDHGRGDQVVRRQTVRASRVSKTSYEGVTPDGDLATLLTWGD